MPQNQGSATHLPKARLASCAVRPGPDPLSVRQCTLDPDTSDPTDNLTEQAIEFCQRVGSMATTASDIVGKRDPAVYRAIEEGIQRVNRNAAARPHHVQKWAVLQRDFSIAGGELGRCASGSGRTLPGAVGEGARPRGAWWVPPVGVSAGRGRGVGTWVWGRGVGVAWGRGCGGVAWAWGRGVGTWAWQPVLHAQVCAGIRASERAFSSRFVSLFNLLGSQWLVKLHRLQVYGSGVPCLCVILRRTCT